MKETGILMVDAMRDKAVADLKTQTRRVIVPQPSAGIRCSPFTKSGLEDAHGRELRCRFGVPGDRLYLKEDHRLTRRRISGKLCIIAEYRTNYEDTGSRQYKWEDLNASTRKKLSKIKSWGRWRSKLLMYKFLARVWFELTEIRAQRVQDISEADAKAEGVGQGFRVVVMIPDGSPNYRISSSYRGGFANLWCNINEDRGYAWHKNPWCWALTFRRLKDI